MEAVHVAKALGEGCDAPERIVEEPKVIPEEEKCCLIVAVRSRLGEEPGHRISVQLDTTVTGDGAAPGGDLCDRQFSGMRIVGLWRAAEVTAIPIPRAIKRRQHTITHHAVDRACGIDQP